jgi:hypothetical protein
MQGSFDSDARRQPASPKPSARACRRILAQDDRHFNFVLTKKDFDFVLKNTDGLA